MVAAISYQLREGFQYFPRGFRVVHPHGPTSQLGTGIKPLLSEKPRCEGGVGPGVGWGSCVHFRQFLAECDPPFSGGGGSGCCCPGSRTRFLAVLGTTMNLVVSLLRL